MEENLEGCTDTIKNGDFVLTWMRSDKATKEERVLAELTVMMKNHRNIENLDLMSSTKYYCLRLQTYWTECHRSMKRFKQKYKNWLESDFVLRNGVQNNQTEGQKRGRPRKPFAELGSKAKKIRIEETCSALEEEEIKMISEKASKMFQPPNPQVLSAQKALVLYLDLNLSVRKYNILRTSMNDVYKSCVPSITSVNKIKKSYLLQKTKITECSAELELQELLDKTANSILKTCDPKSFENSEDLKLVCKWGFDGSSGHSLYKQAFTSDNITDEHIFLIALSPLQLLENEKTVWFNPRPSSTLFCRPIKFIFVKESADVVRREEREMKDKIDKLKPYLYQYDNVTIKISFDMLLTMLDGSIGNILSNTNASARCFICKASPKEMNSEAVRHKSFEDVNLRFGLSTLHCWIRFFECILHIGYRLPIKSWQVKGAENKTIVGENKKRIQNDFKKQLALLVDRPKQGFGSTNDGNTARKFFKNYEVSARITGVDCNLIYNLYKILRVLCTGKSINLDKFVPFLEETRRLYVKLYSWYYMPSSLHKVLVHGGSVINFFNLPIGQLSEEALEARHKEIKKLRLSNTRKTSRIDTNTDLMNLLILSSDPELSTLRKVASKKPLEIDDDIKQYLKDMVDD